MFEFKAIEPFYVLVSYLDNSETSADANKSTKLSFNIL